MRSDTAGRAGAAAPPNLVVVIADEWRAQALGCRGGDPVHTPNLDAFAATSRVLTRAVSNYPVCSPYRAMLMSGQYPAHNGVTRNCNSNSTVQLPADTRCWSDVLADAGYQLGYIGKWHLDAPPDDPAEQRLVGHGTTTPDAVVWDAFTPPGRRRHGFGFWYAYGTYNNHLRPHYWTGDGSARDRVDVDAWSPEHETDVGIDFLRRRDPGRPFGLVMSYNPPHMPFDLAPERYRTPYAGAEPRDLLVRPNVPFDTPGGQHALRSVADYFASVTAVDDQIGRLLRELDDLGLTEDTLVLITSDHGEMMGSHGLMHKNWWYDESLLVPFLLRFPGRVAAGVDDLLLSVPDIYPTLLSLMGLKRRIPASVDGTDLSAQFLGGAGVRPESALYLLGGDGPAGPSRLGLRTSRYTFVRRFGEDGGPPVVLYDNEADPYQRRDVAAGNPGLVGDLTDQLRCLVQQLPGTTRPEPDRESAPARADLPPTHQGGRG